MTDMNILFVASVVHEKLLIEILKTQPRYYGIQGQYFMRLMLLGLKANGVKVNVLSNNLAYRYWHSKRGERHCVLEEGIGYNYFFRKQRGGDRVKCPKCGSENTQYVAVHHSGSSGSFTDACCGMMIFGPIGILCGLCGASPGFTDDYWVCHSCGKKFQAGTAKAAEKARQEKIQQELNAKARRKALLSAANPVILQNIDNEVIEAENRYKALKARLKADKQAFLQEYPACKVQNTFRMIGRGIIIALMGFIAFLAIDMDELITIIIWFLAAMVIGVMCMMPPYYIKLSPALTELNEAVENAKKYKEYLDRLKKARDEENGV